MARMNNILQHQMSVQNGCTSTQRVLLFDPCSYSRQAIKNELSKCISSVCSYAEMTAQARRVIAIPESSTLIFRLQGTLTQVMMFFRNIVETITISPVKIFVVVLTDMPLPCARFLLVMAGLPDHHFRNFWFVNDKVSFDCLLTKLINILFRQGDEPCLDSVLLKISNKKVAILFGLLKEFSPLQQSIYSNTRLNNIYYHRSALLKMLSLPRLHNLYCGHYLRTHLSECSE